MLSQGWIPGSLLGATNINGNTEASSSHIRITRREANCGLGRPRRGAQDDSHCTGLDVFQGILARLNGHAQLEIGAAKIASENLKTVNYLESRWQVLKFVSGGFLVGDRLENTTKHHEQMQPSPIAQSITSSDFPVCRGFEAEMVKDRNHAKSSNGSTLCKLRRPKTKRPCIKGVDSDMNLQLVSLKSQSSYSQGSQEPHEKVASDVSQSAVLERPKRGREAPVAERKHRKKQRRVMENLQVQGQPQLLMPKKDVVKPPESRSTLFLAGLSNRHAVRQRYIRQKKMAMMDTKALNEVCYIVSIRERLGSY
jgi:Pin2-interacting protein X1